MRYEFRPLVGWPDQVTEDRRRSPFSAPWDRTLALLIREVEYLGGDLIVIQVDANPADVRRDGMLYARAKIGFPGVRIAFDSIYGPLTYSTDRYPDWRDNVRAIALALEALRAVDRYGVTHRGEQYRGWTALSAEPTKLTMEQAAELIAEHAGRRWTAQQILTDPAALAAAYKAAAKQHHPDAGGDPAEFRRITEARDLIAGGGAR